MVKDYLNRTIVRVFFTGKWRRSAGIVVGVITVLGILVAAATSLYTAFHGAASPILPK